MIFSIFPAKIGISSQKSADFGQSWPISGHLNFESYLNTLGLFPNLHAFIRSKRFDLYTKKCKKFTFWQKRPFFSKCCFCCFCCFFGYHGVVFQKVQAQGFQKSIWSLGLSLTNKKLISFLFLKHHCYSPLF